MLCLIDLLGSNRFGSAFHVIHVRISTDETFEAVFSPGEKLKLRSELVLIVFEGLAMPPGSPSLDDFILMKASRPFTPTLSFCPCWSC